MPLGSHTVKIPAERRPALVPGQLQSCRKAGTPGEKIVLRKAQQQAAKRMDASATRRFTPLRLRLPRPLRRRDRLHHRSFQGTSARRAFAPTKPPIPGNLPLGTRDLDRHREDGWASDSECRIRSARHQALSSGGRAPRFRCSTDERRAHRDLRCSREFRLVENERRSERPIHDDVRSTCRDDATSRKVPPPGGRPAGC